MCLDDSGWWPTNQQMHCNYVGDSFFHSDQYRARGSQLLFGAWYRLRDSFIFMGGVKVNALTVRVSYDMNSTLFVPEKGVDLAQNSMEISIQYSLSKNLDIRKVSNPLF